MKIMIWGCGERTKCFMKNYISPDIVLGFIDNNDPRNTFMGKKVYRPTEIVPGKVLDEVDYVLVTVRNFNICTEIYGQIQKLCIPERKILFVYNYEKISRHSPYRQIQQQNDEEIKKISEQLFWDCVWGIKRRAVCANDSTRCQFDLVDSDLIIGSGKLEKEEIYLEDYTRYRTFEFCANEIERKNLQGVVAEVGVNWGRFARLLNLKFSNRELYLFDSFESFRPEEYQKELQANRVMKGFDLIFKNTSEEIVLAGLHNPEKCIVRKGYFPDSLIKSDMDKRFVFVSLDVDLEESTYQGLCFFYPRLVEGGYIFLHDYNNYFLEGVKAAVERFEKDRNVCLKRVPICDEGGTLVIVK